MTDQSKISDVVDKIFQENPAAVDAALKDEHAINYLVGLSMKATRGQADPNIINKLIRKRNSLNFL